MATPDVLEHYSLIRCYPSAHGTTFLDVVLTNNPATVATCVNKFKQWLDPEGQKIVGLCVKICNENPALLKMCVGKHCLFYQVSSRGKR